jgi:hypothetical protein
MWSRPLDLQQASKSGSAAVGAVGADRRKSTAADRHIMRPNHCRQPNCRSRGYMSGLSIFFVTREAGYGPRRFHNLAQVRCWSNRT